MSKKSRKKRQNRSWREVLLPHPTEPISSRPAGRSKPKHRHGGYMSEAQAAALADEIFGGSIIFAHQIPEPDEDTN